AGRLPANRRLSGLRSYLSFRSSPTQRTWSRTVIWVRRIVCARRAHNSGCGRRIVLGFFALLQLSRRRRIRLRVAEWHRLRHGRRFRTRGRRRRNRLAEIVRAVNVRRDEEQDLRGTLRHELALKKVSQ